MLATESQFQLIQSYGEFIAKYHRGKGMRNGHLDNEILNLNPFCMKLLGRKDECRQFQTHVILVQQLQKKMLLYFSLHVNHWKSLAHRPALASSHGHMPTLCPGR